MPPGRILDGLHARIAQIPLINLAKLGGFLYHFELSR
jgi:hypothetical protein